MRSLCSLHGGGEKRYNLSGRVGCPTAFRVVNLPFYAFGADEDMCVPGGLDPRASESLPTPGDPPKNWFVASMCDGIVDCYPISFYSDKGPEMCG